MYKLDSYHFFDPPPGSGQIDRFQANFISVVKGVIKVDKGEILRLYFEHICMGLLCSVFFQENYPYAVKVNNLCSYHILDQFYMFFIKIDKGEILRSIFNYLILLFLVFLGKLPLCGQIHRPYPLFVLSGSGQFDAFLTYVISRELLRLYFKHISMLLLCSSFPCRKMTII